MVLSLSKQPEWVILVKDGPYRTFGQFGHGHRTDKLPTGRSVKYPKYDINFERRLSRSGAGCSSMNVMQCSAKPEVGEWEV